MARTFFTGLVDPNPCTPSSPLPSLLTLLPIFLNLSGTMPSFDLFTYFQQNLRLQRSWFINGSHYGRTSEAWLKLQDAHKAEGLRALELDAEKKGLSKAEYEWS